MKPVDFPPREVLPTSLLETRDCTRGLLGESFGRFALHVAVATRPDVLRLFEIATREGHPNTLPRAKVIGHRLARDARMVDDIAVVALRPPRVFLRSPQAVNTSHDALAGNVRELWDFLSIGRGDDSIEAPEIERDLRIQGRKFSRSWEMRQCHPNLDWDRTNN